MSTILQHYMPVIHTVLANIILSAFLLGTLTVLAMVSMSHLVRRGFGKRSTQFMVGSALILYASAASHFAMNVAYSVGYGRLLNLAVTAAASSSHDLTSSSSTDMAEKLALIAFKQSTKSKNHIISLVLAIIITVGDTIVWWRVCILWRKKLVLALGVALIASTFVSGILSAIYGQCTDDSPGLLLGYCDTYGGISTFVSFLTNAIATSLVGRTAWTHRKTLRQCPDNSMNRWNTPTMKVLTLLFESGLVYCIILAMAAVVVVLMHSKAAHSPSVVEFLTSTYLFFTGCFVMILAIYPTIIIFIVAHNRSPIDGGLVSNANQNNTSATLLPSIVFGGTSESSNGSTISSSLNPSPRREQSA